MEPPFARVTVRPPSRQMHRTPNGQEFVVVISRSHRLPPATRGKKVAG
jgi:hypothetical protein